MIRRARPDGDPASWLTEADAPIADWRKGTETFQVTLKLEIGDKGQVTGCTPDQRGTAVRPDMGSALCPFIVQRAKLVPALRADGLRMADQFTVSLGFQYSDRIGARPGPLIKSYGLAPAPPPSSEFDPQLRTWPPSPQWLSRFAGPPVFKTRPEQPGEAALSGPLIGLVLGDRKTGAPECRVVLSSGDASQDERACAFVRKTLKPSWTVIVPVSSRRWPLLLSPAGKGFRAVQPNVSLAGRTRLEDGEVARLAALWRPVAGPVPRVGLSGSLGADGRPATCRIYDSSGNDAADALACRLFRTEARITPARDVFGQPIANTWVSMDLR